VPTPYFAVTDKSGIFAIENVPDDAYSVRVWHPKLKEFAQEVTVSAETTVNLELKRK